MIDRYDWRGCSPPTEVHIDRAVVAQLVEMGFAYEGCRKAVYHTQNTGIEPAMNWVMENMGNPGKESDTDRSLNLNLPDCESQSLWKSQYILMWYTEK